MTTPTLIIEAPQTSALIDFLGSNGVTPDAMFTVTLDAKDKFFYVNAKVHTASDTWEEHDFTVPFAAGAPFAA